MKPISKIVLTADRVAKSPIETRPLRKLGGRCGLLYGGGKNEPSFKDSLGSYGGFMVGIRRLYGCECGNFMASSCSRTNLRLWVSYVRLCCGLRDRCRGDRN